MVYFYCCDVTVRKEQTKVSGCIDVKRKIATTEDFEQTMEELNKRVKTRICEDFPGLPFGEIEVQTTTFNPL